MYSVQFAPGVTKLQQTWWDEYEGTAADMIAAGLVKAHELPGVGNNGKQMMTFAADGQRLTRGCSRNRNQDEEAGYRQIRTIARGKLRMIYRVGRVEGNARFRARHAAEGAKHREREEAARAWPFPICLGVPC